MKGATLPMLIVAREHNRKECPVEIDPTEVVRLSATAHVDIIERNQGSWSEIYRLDSIIGQPFDIFLQDVCFYMEATIDEGQIVLSKEAHRTVNGLGWVYALINSRGRVLYVGKTKNRIGPRMRTHFTRPQFGVRSDELEMSPSHVVGWHVADACHRLERAALLAMQPPLNVADLA